MPPRAADGGFDYSKTLPLRLWGVWCPPAMEGELGCIPLSYWGTAWARLLGTRTKAVRWRDSTGCASLGIGQGSCSRATSFLLSHLTEIAYKELYISRHCMCRASSYISLPVAGAFPKPHDLCSQQCPELSLCSSLLCCTDSHMNMSTLKAFLCKVPLCSLVITLDSAVLCQTIGVGLLHMLQLSCHGVDVP